MHVARVVCLPDKKGRGQPGSLKGKLHVGAKFFEPLPAAELDTWKQTCSVPCLPVGCGLAREYCNLSA